MINVSLLRNVDNSPYNVRLILLLLYSSVALCILALPLCWACLWHYGAFWSAVWGPSSCCCNQNVLSYGCYFKLLPVHHTTVFYCQLLLCVAVYNN